MAEPHRRCVTSRNERSGSIAGARQVIRNYRDGKELIGLHTSMIFQFYPHEKR